MKFQALVTYSYTRKVDVVANDLDDARAKLDRIIAQSKEMVGTPEFGSVDIDVIGGSITVIEPEDNLEG